MYLAIARKWRPAQFDDLVGQGHVVQTLKNAILFNRVSHAYLFSGARGTGKTSVARIFAKVLRCPHANEGNSCNTCSECVAISESRSVDVIEIDGASNNGVDAVRGIRDNVAYGPTSGTYKIYIIDEVHMLSLSAFNALLKTLEEPPSHVVFILATTEVHKIPLTVLGRCQRFEFRRLSQGEILGRMKHVLASEKTKISDEGLRVIAGHSDGSLRDALSLLDQVLSFHHNGLESQELKAGEVAGSLGLSDSDAARRFLKYLTDKNIPALVKLIGDTYLAGVDLQHFSECCLAELRLLYLMVLSRENKATLTPDELEISGSHFAELAELSKQVSLIQIERMSQILSRTIHQLDWSRLPRYTLEMAAVRMCLLEGLSQMENLVLGTEIPVMEEPRRAPNSVTEQGHEASPNQGPWKDFVGSAMRKRPILGALLSHANFRLEQSGKTKKVVLAFPDGSFYEKQVADAKNRQDIAKLISEFFGVETSAEFSNQLAQTHPSLVKAREEEEHQMKKKALEHPDVTRVKDILRADIVDVSVTS